MKSWGSSDSSTRVIDTARWRIHSGETNSSNSPPSSSTAPFKPFAMMPISKTRSNQFCGLNIGYLPRAGQRGYVGPLALNIGAAESGIDMLCVDLEPLLAELQIG